MEDGKYRGALFSILDPMWNEGPSDDVRPFGPNMAIQRQVIDDGLRFDPEIGPGSNDYIMGNETDFVERATSAGPSPVFLPDSRVWHTIRPEQMDLRWIFGRVRRFGRSWVLRTASSPGARIGDKDSAPRWTYSGIVEHVVKALAHYAAGRRPEACDRLLDVAFEVGRIDAYRGSP